MERLRAQYEVESPKSLEHAAKVIAGEQSSGTFLKLAGETDALRQRSGARVELIEERSQSASPSLPTRTQGSHYSRGVITLSWPLDNMGTSLTNVLATVAGNLFELADVSALRLIDVEFPDAFSQAYPGPAFGRKGTLDLAGVSNRPMIGTIIKPSVGLSPDETAQLVLQLIEGGIDFIKDDELQGNGAHCPFPERARKVMRVINDYADRTGKKPMYAFNITGEVDEMKRNADLVHELGGTCIMVSLFSIGLAGLSAIRAHAALPLHCHRNGWGLFSRSPDIGISFRAWQKFWRLAGADHLHVNGIANKFTESDETVMESARALGENVPPNQTYHAMPVFSSGQTAVQMEQTIAALGHTDFIYCAGGGIIGHPGGVAGGVASIQQAAAAAVQGIPVDEFAKDHEELRLALSTFRKN
ncbi:ribulose-bisphosphate carboxylase large subunit family protein [Thalassospira australica]|uniref:ribulose-bisphosphate carboxylase large subunit family protein n=1 Tax=Thalassospira australica TaxID=1528106 RepID=UPI00051A318A|nr:ribulose-bisphosphate carboxylase large subunit family protein [Thalassospira australica]